MVTVRPAVHDDIPWLLDELEAFASFFNSRCTLFPGRVHGAAVLDGLIGVQPFFVAEVRDASSGEIVRPVGFIAGALLPHFFNPELRVLSELLWWVTPSARGTRAGAQLLAAFVDYGRAHADWIIMTLEAESPIDPASLLKRGFTPKESNYLLEVAH